MRIKHYQDCIVVFIRIRVSERMKKTIRAQYQAQYGTMVFIREVVQ